MVFFGIVGIGNIGGMVVVILVGGFGVVFWFVMVGLFGMVIKFVECVVGVKYWKINFDGSILGGFMYYLEWGLKECGWGVIGKLLGIFYGVVMVIGCLGIGNMF